MTNQEKRKQELLDFWRANSPEIINLSVKDVYAYPLDKAYELAEAYADTLWCPCCDRQTIEVFNDKDITAMNCWRLQCQRCGMETPELLDLEKVITIWDKICHALKEENDG